jgi:hypothetical protein
MHHKVLHVLREIVTGLPKLSVEQHGVCKGCVGLASMPRMFSQVASTNLKRF